MLARAHTFTIEGLQTRRVTVEVDIRPGLPCFTIVGLADAAVREARERVQAAIRNAGYEFPARRITANLAPGDVPKAGPGLDLALACAVALVNSCSWKRLVPSQSIGSPSNMGSSNSALSRRMRADSSVAATARSGRRRPSRGSARTGRSSREASR
jgi:hypothetical protein